MALAGMQAQARSLARKGRGGDTAIGHLTPGEVVVPASVLGQPGVRDRLLFGFQRSRLPMGRYTVGGTDDSRNPRTGMREYRGGGPSGPGGQGSPGASGGDGDESRDFGYGPGDNPGRGQNPGRGAAPGVGDQTGGAGQGEGFDQPGGQMEGRSRASVDDVIADIADKKQAVDDFFTQVMDKVETPAEIVGRVVDQIVSDITDRTPATAEQMAGHQADHAATGGGESPRDRGVPLAAGRPAGQAARPGMLGAMDPANPLAMLGETGSEADYWRPQLSDPGVSWLARVNADIDRARRGGRQRSPAMVGRIADPTVRRPMAA